MRIPFEQLKNEFKRVLLKYSFDEKKADLCASIFASNSRDGVYSHGLNRFPAFVDNIRNQRVVPEAEPSFIEKNGVIEIWDGNLGPGMYIATLAMKKVVEIARENGMGCVAVRNTNHWMRGGTYGWQAADEGCIGICFTNAIAGMPAWGGKEAVLGNNPLVIAVPHPQGHIVLDMAMSQFSYGKMQEYELKEEQLPVHGGYDEKGNLTTDPVAIRTSRRTLPIGFWKGSGLAMILDILLVALTGGRTTAAMTTEGHEVGVSQCFIAISQPDMHQHLIEEIIAFTKFEASDNSSVHIAYPGEHTLQKRLENEQQGIPVNEAIWQKVKEM